ncbi:hypothetical protein DPMN_115106 [Dreissena polymorpha]|uniref:Secreted protein n=1 Tax=Dreissena polymorpha TaxID=45954 RepID=A0A9D4QSM3_DREPO|nr:hypothetical protein DPMN_115106 [Dreissena polymorpha]
MYMCHVIFSVAQVVPLLHAVLVPTTLGLVPLRPQHAQPVTPIKSVMLQRPPVSLVPLATAAQIRSLLTKKHVMPLSTRLKVKQLAIRAHQDIIVRAQAQPHW